MTDPQSIPLRDIHLPPAPPWWPPASGWWLLMGCLLAGVALYFWWRRRAHGSARAAARRELLALRERALNEDAATLLPEISVLLRRLSLSEYPRREIAGVTGEAWLEFLDRPLSGRPFSTGPGRILLDGPYRRNPQSVAIATLLDLCEQWVGALAQRRRKAG